MKKSIAYALLIGVVTACGSNRYFVKKPSEIREKIKTVVVLPVYIDKQFFPILPQDAKSQVYPDTFQKTIRTTFSDKISVLNQFVVESLKKSNYGFIVKEASPSDLNQLTIETRSSEFLRRRGLVDKEIDYNFPFNRAYTLSPASIKQIIATYQADAVLFQYIQVSRVWKMHSWSKKNAQYSLTMPFDTVKYLPTLYGADGSVYYGGERINNFSRGDHWYYSNHNGDQLVYLQKAKASNTGDGYEPVTEDLQDVMTNISTLFSLRSYGVFSLEHGSLSGLYAP